MKGETRRERIIKMLQKAEKQISGAALAREFSVSRQIIVQDIALLRATGYDICSNNRGYYLKKKNGVSRALKEDMQGRLERQFAFCREIDKEKFIKRQTYLSDGTKKENDAEHAWHMAIMTLLLSEYANEEIDVFRTISMLLIHDLVEIDAGDTYAYDTVAKETQKSREDAAKKRIFSLLPEDQMQDLLNLFDEFEACKTPEAKFAHAMDNFQPLMLNNSNNGEDWRTHTVTASQVYGRHNNTKSGSEKLFEVTDQIIQENIKSGNIKES